MCKVILFGGTTEGRLLARFLHENKIGTVVCVATEYGGSLLDEGDYINVLEKRLDAAEMEELIRSEMPHLVVDATHPYAKAVTENIVHAAERTGVEYMRVIRDSDGSAGGDAVYVETLEDAIACWKYKKSIPGHNRYERTDFVAVSDNIKKGERITK